MYMHIYIYICVCIIHTYRSWNKSANITEISSIMTISRKKEIISFVYSSIYTCLQRCAVVGLATQRWTMPWCGPLPSPMPANEWMVLPPMLIAAMPVGAVRCSEPWDTTAARPVEEKTREREREKEGMRMYFFVCLFVQCAVFCACLYNMIVYYVHSVPLWICFRTKLLPVPAAPVMNTLARCLTTRSITLACSSVGRPSGAPSTAESTPPPL